MPSGVRAIDLYFEARLVFVDRPDVRLRTYDEPERRAVVVEAKNGLAVVSWAADEHFMAVAPAWAVRDASEMLRRHFDHYEKRAGARALDRIRGGARVS